MDLQDLLRSKRDVILEQWRHLIYSTYPEETAGFLKRERDRFNKVSFQPVRTPALRLDIQLQDKVYKKGNLGPPDGNYLSEDLTWYECGIIEWRVNP